MHGGGGGESWMIYGAGKRPDAMCFSVCVGEKMVSLFPAPPPLPSRGVVALRLMASLSFPPLACSCPICPILAHYMSAGKREREMSRVTFLYIMLYVHTCDAFPIFPKMKRRKILTGIYAQFFLGGGEGGQPKPLRACQFFFLPLLKRLSAPTRLFLTILSEKGKKK